MAAEELNPQEELAQEELRYEIQVLRQLAFEEPGKSEHFFNLGYLQAQAGEYNSALLSFREALNLDAKLIEAYFHIARCYTALGFVERAIGAHEDAVRVDETNSNAWFNLGVMHHNTNNDLDRAILCYKTAVKHDPYHVDARRGWSHAAFLLEDTSTALEQITIVLSGSEAGNTRAYISDHMQAAMCYSAQGKHQQAADEYRKCLALDENNAEAHTNFGNCLVKLGQQRDAAEHYRRAVILRPDSTDFLFNLAEFQYLHESVDVATENFKKLAQSSPKDGEVWYYLALCLQNTSPFEAGRCCEQAQECGLKTADLFRLTAKINEQLGLHEKASEARLNLSEIQPFEKENNYALGLDFLRQGKSFKAWQYLNKIRYPEAGDVPDFFLLSQNLRLSGNTDDEFACLEMIIKADSEFSLVWLRLAEIALQKKLYLKSFEYYSRVADHVKNDVSVWGELSYRLLEINEADKAVECCFHIFDICRYSPKSFAAVIRAFRRGAALDYLIEVILEQTRIENWLPEQLLAFLKILDSMELYEQSGLLYELLWEKYPDNLDIANAYTQHLISCGRVEQAKGYLKKVLEQRGDYELWNNIGEAYYLEGNYEDAKHAFLESLQYRQDDYRVWFNLGNIEVREQNIEQALEYYHKSLELQGKESKTWYNLGLVKEHLGNMEEAKTHFATAVQHNRRNYQAWNALGIVHYEEKKAKTARHCFLRALGANRKYIKAWNNLAEAFEEIGQVGKALSCEKEMKRLQALELG